MAPAVSVVLPTYNRAAVLGRAIRSVLAQTYEDFELIVVDDASTDDTAEVIQSLGDPRLRYLRHEVNKGGAAARNTGIAAASGDFIAFQDSDDEWLPDKLARQVSCMEPVTASIGAVYCAMTRREGEQMVRIPGPHIARCDGDLSSALLYENFIGTPTLLVRRECLNRIGLFWPDLPRFQDWELVIRLARSYSIRFIAEPLVLAHNAAGNISSNPQAAVIALELILDRHRELFRQEPRALAIAYKSLGVYRCAAGATAKGRKDFVRSLCAYPIGLAAWIGLILSFCGAQGMRAALDFQMRLRSLRRSLRHG